MTQNQIKIRYLVKKLRYKYKEDPIKNAMLDRIYWYSYPIVYPNHEVEDRVISRAIDRRKEKKKRVNHIIADMVKSYDELHFVTLTFNDDSLATLSERTRHRYAQQWLNDNCKDYFANVDYGAKNGREHFHGIVALKEHTNAWKYGFMNVKKACISSDYIDRCKISSYLLKLSNHACKVGTGKSFRKRGIKEVDSLPF